MDWIRRRKQWTLAVLSVVGWFLYLALDYEPAKKVPEIGSSVSGAVSHYLKVQSHSPFDSGAATAYQDEIARQRGHAK